MSSVTEAMALSGASANQTEQTDSQAGTDSEQEDGQTAAEPDAEMLRNISQHCSSLKQSLGQLQRADSRTRSYLGSAYETVSSAFITPLGLRLIKNSQNNADLFAIQSDFADEQARFRAAYTTYMRELDALIGTDCVNRPAEFYAQLEVTRTYRAILHDSALAMTELVAKQYAAVVELQGTLK